jgi:hypothetical protein
MFTAGRWHFEEQTMRRALAILLVLAAPGLARAQTMPGQIPGTLPAAPPVVVAPPAPPPAPVPSVVTPSAPLPGVTFRNGPVTYPSGGYVTPSYRSKAVKSPPCKKRRGRCRTS